jgi:phosphoglycerate dehydrogenase-like enzyme
METGKDPLTRIAVTSRSFSRHPVLRAELLERGDEITFNDAGGRLEGAGLIDFIVGHDSAITGLERLNEAFFAALPGLRVVSKYGVGIDMIDLDAMARHGVRLGWTGGTNKRSVSELVIAFAVSLLRHLPEATRVVETGEWRQPIGTLLTGRCVGIIGCGHVGKDLGVLLRAFDCRVLAYDILKFPDYYEETGVEPSSLDSLLKAADIVTLHLPLDQSTERILNAERLALKRSGALLINTARGGLVDEAALKAHLRDGRLAVWELAHPSPACGPI